MKYYSCSKIAEQITESSFEEVTTKDVKKALKDLGYLDSNDRPTQKAFGLYTQKYLNYCQRSYIAWCEDVVTEVQYELL